MPKVPSQKHAEPEFFAYLKRLHMNGMRVVSVTRERVAQGVRNATCHARAQVHACRPEDRHDAGCHVLAAMLADSFDHGQRAAVAHRETLSGTAGHVEFSGRCTVEYRVTHQYVAAQGRFVPGSNGERATAQTFSNVIIRFTQQAEFHALDQEGSEALSSCARELAGDDTCYVGTVATAQHFSTQMRADCAVGVGDAEAMTPRAQGVELVGKG